MEAINAAAVTLSSASDSVNGAGRSGLFPFFFGSRFKQQKYRNGQDVVSVSADVNGL